MTRAEFDKAVREAVIAGNASGSTFCNGHPLAIIQAGWDYDGFQEDGCTFGCCRCGRCTTTITGNIAKWPEWAPWHGPAANLRVNFRPETLVQYADRYVTDWEGNPPDPSKIERAAVLESITRQLKVATDPVLLPELPHVGEAERWIEPVAWPYGSSITVWRARRPCQVTGEIILDTGGPLLPVVLFDNFDTIHNRIYLDGSDYRIPEGVHEPLPWHREGSRYVYEVSARLPEGGGLFIGSTRMQPTLTVSGAVRLAFDHPGEGGEPPRWVDPDDDLARRIDQAAREVTTSSATAAWARSNAGRLQPVFGMLDPNLVSVLNTHGERREQVGEVVGAGETCWALPAVLVRELLALDKTDRERYRDDVFQCGDFSLSLKTHLARKYGKNIVSIVLDTSAGPPPELRTRATDNGHAYCAFLTYDDQGRLSWMFVEPQTDEEIAGGLGAHYRMRHGRVWIATARTPEARVSDVRRRRFVWIAHGDTVIRAEEQFSVRGDDVTAADQRYPDVDFGLGGRPLPEGVVKAAENDWGSAWWLPEED